MENFNLNIPHGGEQEVPKKIIVEQCETQKAITVTKELLEKLKKSLETLKEKKE